MKKKKIFFLTILLIFFPKGKTYSNDLNHYIQPETSSDKEFNTKLKNGEFQNFAIVTANNYASKIGYDILKSGGTVADASVAVQLTLGLVEPQSSGLGGGIFLTYFDKKTNKVLSFEGREKAPKNLKESVFLHKNGKPKKFFDAAIGGSSVGVPATLKTLFLFHKKFGKLEWNEVIKPVVNLSSKGFIPPNRLVNAIKKEKFLFELSPDSIYNQVKENPKIKFINENYTKTLIKISKNISSFYNGEIAKDIVLKINKSKNPGNMTLDDIKNYNPEMNNALCYKLRSGYKICGPNLPSSGTICIIKAFVLYEHLYKKNLKKPDLQQILDILNFVYHVRDNYLGDPKFVSIDIERHINEKEILRDFNNFKKKSVISRNNLQKTFNSTTHFTLIDKYNNVLSATSSIENSFGSRLFTNGFFLNNQLTDFSFKKKDNSKVPLKNLPEGEKRPLSSMSPMIVFDTENKFLLTTGSPGGKAIISYVFKSLISILFLNENIEKAIKKPNYIKINGKVFLEDKLLNNELDDKGTIRSLTSGIAIIKRIGKKYHASADHRRDGTVMGN